MLKKKKAWGDGGVYLRGKTWWIFYQSNGQTIRESSKSDNETEANRLRRRRLAEVHARGSAGPSIERTQVSELLDDLLRDYELKRKTLWWAQLNVENHLRPFFKHHKASRVGTRHIQDYVVKKRAEKLSDSTINRHLALLRRAFNLGARAEPAKVLRVPHIESFDESKGVRRGFFEHTSYVALLAELPDELKPVATFAYHTGCRKAEILALKWKQVDLENRMIRLNPGETKNKDGRMIPLTSDLYKELVSLKKEREKFWSWSPWVFSRGGEPIKSFYGTWRAACKRAGLDDSLLHDMRRTGVRNLVRAGVPERVAMQISGHKTRSIFDRYDITSETDLKNAAALLDRHLKQQKRA